MNSKERRLVTVGLTAIALMVLCAGPALADADPFSQPLGNPSSDTGSPPGVGGNDPFSPVGSSTSVAYDPGGDTAGSPTGDGTTGTSDGYDPGQTSGGGLPFTGVDVATWLVVAYGLLGAGAVSLLVAETFGVSRRRRSPACPSRPAAARSSGSSR